MLQATQPNELSCDEVYELLDQYAEIIARGEDAAQLMPLIKHHLDMCEDCREEYRALLRILEATPS
jgi:predicted anti-sigma-YlaC factor YlaD